MRKRNIVTYGLVLLILIAIPVDSLNRSNQI
jgi:hypothetical protein